MKNSNKVLEKVIAELEASRDDIENAILKDHGLPPALPELASNLEDLEQRFAKDRDRSTFAQLKDQVKNVIQGVHRLADNWSRFFRGRSYKNATNRQAESVYSSSLLFFTGGFGHSR